MMKMIVKKRKKKKSLPKRKMKISGPMEVKKRTQMKLSKVLLEEIFNCFMLPVNYFLAIVFDSSLQSHAFRSSFYLDFILVCSKGFFTYFKIEF